jgi:hypothetical protein
VNVLHKLHAALVPGGLIIDSQPVSAHPAVTAASRELGTLDLRAWAQTIAEIDVQIATTIHTGLFTVQAQQELVVTDSFTSGAELVAVVSSWAGTEIAPALAEQIAAEPGEASVHQDIRLRILRAC